MTNARLAKVALGLIFDVLGAPLSFGASITLVPATSIGQRSHSALRAVFLFILLHGLLKRLSLIGHVC
jgi:hypothetical protein